MDLIKFLDKNDKETCWNINPGPAESRYALPAFANSVDPDHLASEEAS